jgi:hypothetical protein
MPKPNGEPLDPIPEETFDGEKYTTELKKSDHVHKFYKVSSVEIKCNCGVGYVGSNVDILLQTFDKR